MILLSKHLFHHIYFIFFFLDQSLIHFFRLMEMFLDLDKTGPVLQLKGLKSCEMPEDLTNSFFFFCLFF